jgi:phosphoribosyl-ATP pyrophosphohydrolase/phosphoribosyl-AMP cyclohydrolase
VSPDFGAWLAAVKFDAQGLVPVVLQRAADGAVLTLAYANREALERTRETGDAHFYSRSRSALWKKGETSGHTQRVVRMVRDCDGDAVLYEAVPTGPACHTGEATCFSEPGVEVGEARVVGWRRLQWLYELIERRRAERPEGSYTAQLFEEGMTRIAKKVGEEGVEVGIAALAQTPERVADESADLLYHLLVLWVAAGVEPEDVLAKLAARHRGR